MSDKQLKNTYFVACNSKNGFVSFFDEIFFSERNRDVFILKGGPGTGKSYFMKKIASEAEKRGLSVERCVCSSYSESLDAIIILALSAYIIDGTTPHTAHPIYPGASESIVNLGDFFDLQKLRDQKDAILDLNAKKSKYYKTAYAYLNACGTVYDIHLNSVKPAVIAPKLSASAKREACRFGTKTHGCKIKKRLIRAIGTKGEVSTDAFLSAKNRIGIADCLGTGHMFLRALVSELKSRTGELTVYLNPLSPDKYDGVFLPEYDTAYVIIPEPDERFDRIINQRRFIDKKTISADSAKLRFAKKCADSLKNEALVNLKKAGEIHSELEKIYTDAMDFDRKEAFTETFISELFGKHGK